ncbi:hypothetical protein BH09GEM1_BH09GEM1_05170 [soil metagenome]
MASTARIDELKKKFDENPRRYFAPLANEFRKAGEIEQAIMICEEFLPQQPGHMSGHIVYGQALYEVGRLPESRTVFETALGLDPENLIALRHLGDIARGQHDPAAARGWYVRVLDADPRNEEIQALIAGVDADTPLDATLVDVEPLMGRSAAGPADLGFAVEKEVMPFDQPPTQEIAAVPFDQLPTREVVAMPFDQLATREVSARPMVDPSLADTAPVGVPIIPPAPASPAHEPDLIDGFSLLRFEDASHATSGGAAATPTDGLEYSEFAPPSEHVPAAELDASLDSGVPSFSSPEHHIEALEGLEGSGGQPHAIERAPQRFQDADVEPLDLEGGLIPSGHGDSLRHSSIAATAPESLDEPAPATDLDFDLAAPDEDGPAGGSGGDIPEEISTAAVEVPVELPPEVIAAEAELIDAGETPAPTPAVDETLAPDAVARPPFVTETMAELYLAQGFREQALAVYSDLLAASPNDERLAGIVASLAPESAPSADAAGPNVRDFFARIASRRPGSAAAALEPPAYDDFAADEEPYAHADVIAATAEATEAPPAMPELVSRTSGDVAPAIERAAATQTPEGSIDVLFGNRSAGKSEDSAAAALAQAFGGGSDVAAPPPIEGRPAHAAKGELTLDSVFRDGPARPARSSQSFSFDQFFAGGLERPVRLSPPRGVAAASEGPTAPAERGADDIEQFNSWLKGLKQR